ncbi:MAG TPA: MmgE/PrpD family protein [Vicinamibacterales bacterium]|nr:MmgE/PrpD family protein [Vicinamibacterales bacterium]
MPNPEWPDDAARLTRRDVLQRAGWMVAGAASLRQGYGGQADLLAASQAAATPAQTAADLPVSDVMMRLSTYMSEARNRALPDEVLERAKRHVLDTFAAMVSGAELAPGRAAIGFARAYGGKSIATIVGDTTLCGPIEAALVNGTLAHADETDDTLAPGPWHPGCNVVPAALALGEQFGASGAHFIRAVVLGYDIGTRVMAAIQPGLPNSHKLSYGIAGVFGAAAAGGSLAGMDPQKMRWVLSYSAQQSSGIESFPRDPDHIEKGFIFGGMPARSGVTSVMLVNAGWTGVNDIMSGPGNFILANAPTGKAELLVDRLGERYEITRANIKRWTVGQPVHAPLDAIESLLKQQTIDPGQVQEVVVRYQPGSITDNSGPSDINVQHALAVMLIDRALTFRSIHDKARMQDPAVLRLKAKVRLEPAPTGAGAVRPPLVQIRLADGTRLTQDNVGAGVLGTAANPMSREQLIAKCRDLMSPVLGAAQTTRLIDRVMALEKVANIRELRPLLQAAARSGSPRLSEYPNAK